MHLKKNSSLINTTKGKSNFHSLSKNHLNKLKFMKDKRQVFK